MKGGKGRKGGREVYGGMARSSKGKGDRNRDGIRDGGTEKGERKRAEWMEGGRERQKKEEGKLKKNNDN